MNRVVPLAATRLVTIARFDHPAEEVHRDPPEEQARDFSVSFVEQGGFSMRVGRQPHLLDPKAVFVTWPGLVYRCAHQERRPGDVCFSVAFREPFAEEVLARPGEGSPVVGLTNRLGYLALSLAGAAAVSDELATDALAGELLVEVRQRAFLAAPPLFRPRQLAWYAARVRSARQRLEAEYALPHSLLGLAREAGMSPYHFARVFRELAGAPPHRFLRDVRLREAARRLREGAPVTEACFASGFGNLSHFIRSFRRFFGVLPSRYRG